MLILVDNICPRVQYVFDFIFREALGVTYELTDNTSKWIASDHPTKWSYGQRPESPYPSLFAADILYETGIKPQSITPAKTEHIVPLFWSKNDHQAFDLFASSFYLISRYEEYLPAVFDAHGRYAGYQSVAAENGFLQTMMVNRYIAWLVKWLKGHFPQLAVSSPKATALFTLDIDHPFYQKEVRLDKRIWRSVMSLGKDTDHDKYDTFDFIFESLGERPSLFFFLCPASPTEHDHYSQRESDSFQNLIQTVRSRSRIGIHPSYMSIEKKLIASETQWLSDQHGRPIRSARMHYLKNKLPESYRQMISTDIKYDFSMGYGNLAGWRSGTSIPYLFFDLIQNRVTDLTVYTPCIMDSTFAYGHQSDFRQTYQRLWNEVATYGGCFMPIFHNDILADDEWKKDFEWAVSLI